MTTENLQKDVAIETALLKAMSTKHNYDMYADLINKKRIYESTALVLEDYSKYFKLYPEHTEINFELFYTQFAQSWHNKDLDEDDMSYYRDCVLPAINTAPNTEVESTLLGLVQRQAMQNIAASAEKEFNADKIDEILEDYRKQQSSIVKEYDEECYTIDNIDFSVLDKAEGIPYFLQPLQENLGGLVKGQFVVVSADYGAGKSAFVISQAVEAFKFLHKKNIDRPILYFNSEGTEADVYVRFLSNLYKEKIAGGFEQVLQNIDSVRGSFCKKFKHENFRVFQISGHSLSYVKSKIQKYNPAFVIIDICDVLANEESPQVLKKLYDTLRQLSGSYCPIMGTTQSGDTSYLDKETGQVKSRKWLGDKALYGSKTGKGGAADTILTIGKDDNENSLMRYVAVSKHKRGQPVKLTCELQPEYSYYSELSW